MIRTYTANSLSEFVKIVCEIRHQWTTKCKFYFDPWFRGQQDEAWELKPSIYRLGLYERENEIRSEFKRRALQMINTIRPGSDWAWYFMMQHYRAPTRLLDWTDSALIALFFAINSNLPADSSVKTNAAVWVLDPWWLNQQVVGRMVVLLPDWDEVRPYLPKLYEGQLRKKYPIAVDPPHVALRIAVQHSRFTIHGTNEDGIYLLGERKGAQIAKIVIEKKNIDPIRVDLGTCGIVDTTVFPDLEGLTSEITRFWNTNW